MGLNDACWSLLEKLRLDSFFDDHGIPPWVFPAGLIAIILLTILLMMPAGVKGTCGDSICASGESSSCPVDCPTAKPSKDVKIDVVGGVSGTITLSLVSSDGTVIKSDTGKLVSLVIKGVTADEVRGVAMNPATGESVESDVVRLVDGLNVITIGLSPGFASGDEEGLTTGKGTIKVTIKDSLTNLQIRSTISIVISNGGSRIPVTTKVSNGLEYFVLDAGEFYQVIATADGYREYMRSPEKLKADQEMDALILLQRIDTVLPKANSTICIRDQYGNPITTGAIRLQDVFGGTVIEANLSNDGCATFETDLETTYVAMTTGLPVYCLDAHSSDIRMTPGNQTIDLRVVCGDEDAGPEEGWDTMGWARLKVFGLSSAVLTQSGVITAWYSQDNSQIYGSGYYNTLAAGQDGYTESITVIAGKAFYFIISNLTGYARYASANYTLSPGENSSFDVTLTPTQVCGNNDRESPETCDGTDATACPGQCIPAGQQNQCTCPAVNQTCGNNNREGNEICDGTDDDACPGQCAACACPSATQVCGNNVREGSEICDGLDDFACSGSCLTNCTCPAEELKCVGMPGDLNGDRVVDFDDLPYLGEIVDTIERTGTFEGLSELMTCADVNSDDTITDHDYYCLSAMLMENVEEQARYCGSCVEEMQSYGQDASGKYIRYGLEICHDGLDNDCDGQIDEDSDCQCNATQLCERQWDIDGVITTNDFAVCRSYGHTDFNSMNTAWGPYGWKNETAVWAAECSHRGMNSWGDTQKCSGPENWVSCLLHFPVGFSMSNYEGTYHAEYFGAVGERANTGPIGRLTGCGGCPDCPDGWESVSEKGGGECNCGWAGVTQGTSQPAAGTDVSNMCGPAIWGFPITCECSSGQCKCKAPSGHDACDDQCTDKRYCTCSEVCINYCRYRADPCLKFLGGRQVCGNSGGGVIEICTMKTECMGVLSDFP